MSFSINPSHNFLVDTPIIIEEKPSNDQNGSGTSQTVSNTSIESKDDSNILSKGTSNSGGSLQIHQISGALDDFY